MISLYLHQERLISNIRTALKTNRSVLVQGATGLGKTVVACFMVKSALLKGNTVVFACHRKELIDQASNSFHEVDIEHGFVAAGRPFNPYANVKIASIMSLKNRLDKINVPSLFIIDEAHHSLAASWAKIVDWAAGGGARIVGLTATPWRLNGDGLENYFTEMVSGPSVAWLIHNEYLSDYKAFAPTIPDLTKVNKRAGDYAKDQLENVMLDNVIVGDVVKHYLRLARGKKGLVFCTSVKHSEKITDRFKEFGVNAHHLDANTSPDDRRLAIKAFADGHIEVLTNVELFGEGFDLSSLAGREVPIEVVSLCRPTMSLSLHLQQIGRALRPKEHPAIILDHAGNLMRHGFPDDEFQWSLQARPKPSRKTNDETPINICTCDQCYFVYRLPALSCPNCGFIRPVASRDVDEVDGELREIDPAARRAKRLAEQWQAHSIDDLVELGKKRGYRYPQKWAAHIWTARQRQQKSENNVVRMKNYR